jgi:hypothetical protein
VELSLDSTSSKLVEAPSVEIELRTEWAVKLSEFTDHLLNIKPQIVHFSGHGGNGAIFFEDQLGMAVPRSADGLAGLIEAIGNVECVVLNACHSADLGAATKPRLGARDHTVESLNGSRFFASSKEIMSPISFKPTSVNFLTPATVSQRLMYFCRAFASVCAASRSSRRASKSELDKERSILPFPLAVLKIVITVVISIYAVELFPI